MNDIRLLILFYISKMWKRKVPSDRCLSVCPSCLFCLWRWCIVAKRLDGLGCHLVRR